MIRRCLGGCGTLIQSGSYCSWCKPRNGSTREWRNTRARVLARDGWICQLKLPGCTVTAHHVDHHVPVLFGGADDESNLVAACANCNLAKGAQRT
jgi:5-methylcytosine-specific restriction endonuclease McrA